MKIKIHAVTFVWCALASPLALGWGYEGHKLVCGLAEQKLNQEARRMVTELVSQGQALEDKSDSFAEACLWPDSVKYSTRQDTRPDHYINVPDDANRIDLARDCPAMNCLAIGVQRALTYLAAPAEGKQQMARRAAALRYLGHYIGDLHQPLHVSNGSDWGGNKIRIRWQRETTNLHALWDYHMLEAMGFTYPESLEHLGADLPDAGSVNILGWMNETLQLTRSHAYVGLDGQPIASGARLGMDYMNHNKPVMVQQIRLAAARLALLLNQLAAGQEIKAFVVTAE